ncbi:50S ribosomal protein L11 methyltransferase [Clostridium senegalense]|uniref:50S ribosomal protein L11 methyltransferase n=1 Tax=Clostridium senegalense TaxID=1465809 RepID=UPI000288A614|nr:50S ribosomal protein L11 methyltransferase [Clostridium senegalense]
MFKLTFKFPLSKADEATEKLYIHDIYNVFYESPITITKTDYGYGYYENEDEFVDFNIVVESDDIEEAQNQKKVIMNTLNVNEIKIESINNVELNETLEPIDLNNGWVLCSPEYEVEGKNKINFIPQGAFGTGLHETTQDCLRYILDEDFKNKSVLDIGTGSGILSIATAIKKAETVIAVDIRDVNEEIQLNASLNELDNIDVYVGNILENEITFKDKFDYIIINIGGEETQMFMNFIDNHLKKGGTLLVSGLVEWTFDLVIDKIKDYGYTLISSCQTNEWCTALLTKI